MPTVAAVVTEAPIDLVAGLGLVAGSTYYFQVQGNRGVMLHWGGASAPAVNPAPAATRLSAADTFDVTIGAEPIWAWVSEGGTSRLSATLVRTHLGPPRHIETVDLSGGDYVRESGFILQVNAAGTVVYSTLDGGNTTRSETFAAAGAVQVAGRPVLLRAVYQAGTSNGLSLTAALL